jgi:hypothetical protein
MKNVLAPYVRAADGKEGSAEVQFEPSPFFTGLIFAAPVSAAMRMVIIYIITAAW